MIQVTRKALLALLLCAALLAGAFGALAEDPADVFAAPVDDAVGETGDTELWTDDIADALKAAERQAGEAAAKGAVSINPTNFPDACFREYISEAFDRDGDNMLSEDDLSAIDYIDVSCLEITRLDGIALFPALRILECGTNELTALDLSGCTALEELECSNNYMTKLDVSACKALTSLSASNNPLTEVDAHGCAALQSIYLGDGEEGALTLKLSGCSSLESLEMSSSNLASIDVSNCTSLRWLYLSDNPLTAVNIAGCTALETLDVGRTQLTALDVSGSVSLENLFCSEAKLTQLNASRCTALTCLEMDGNPTMTLNLSGCTAMTYFDFDGELEPITSLDLSGCTSLNTLYCTDNKLTTLNLSGCKALSALDANANPSLSKIDLTGCTLLLRAVADGGWYQDDGAVMFYYNGGGDYASMCVDYGVGLTANGAALSYDILPEDIHFNKYSVRVALGKTLKLKPVIAPTQATARLTWESDNRYVAKVNSKGVVTPVRKGTATITAMTQNGISASIDVEVIAPKPTKVYFKKTSVTVKLGKTLDLKKLVRLKPSDAETTYKWASNKKSVAKVSSDGIVTPVKKGTAVITVKTANGKKATIKVKVAVPKPTGVSISADSKIVEVGKKLKLTAEVKPAQAQTKLTWKSSKPAVATVSNKGVVTGKKAGTTVITVKTANGKKASVKITVRKKQQNKGKCRALLVGQSNYPGGYDLPGCANDVTLIKSMLESVKGGNGGEFNVTIKRDLSHSQLKSAIQTAFAGASENDISLFYYSGHGVVGTEGEYAGAMVMISLNEYFTFGELANMLSRVPGKVIVMCDSCGSGAAVFAGHDEENRAVTVDPAALDAALIAAFENADPGLTVDADGNVVTGDVPNLGELRIANKFYVLTAARHNESSWEDGTNGMFTQWLSNGVGRYGSMPADANNDGTASLKELFKYISDVGDGQSFGGGYHQHVQVYPKNSSFAVFKR